jgi:dienelactone hydrolase
MTQPQDPAFLREKLQQCLGGAWPQPGDLRPRLIADTPKDGYRVQRVEYEVEPGERISAYLLLPEGVTAQNPAPAVAIWHQHGGQFHIGKAEPAGIAGNAMHQTGVVLAKAGYVVLCPDALCFGDRFRPSFGDRNNFGWMERFEFLRYVVQGKCLLWKNILDMRRAVDYLVSRPEVRADRIGCYGHSMGATHSYMVGPWDTRLRAVVTNACLPTYEAIHHHGLLHCFPNFIPGWQQFGDVPDIVGLIAPRRLHMNFGELDSDSPIEFVKRAVQTIAAAYQRAGAGDQFTWHIEPGAGHVLTPAMSQLVLDTFAQTLCK